MSDRSLESSTRLDGVRAALLALGFFLVHASAQRPDAENLLSKLVVSASKGGPVALHPSREIVVRGGHTSAAGFAPDGTALVLGGEVGELLALTYPDLEERWRVRPSDHWIGEVHYAPDGSTVACCGRDLTLHDATTGRELRRIERTGMHGFCWLDDAGERFAYAQGAELTVHDSDGPRVWASFENGIRCLSLDAAGRVRVGDSRGGIWRVLGLDTEPEFVRALDRFEEWVSAIGVDSFGGVDFAVSTTGELWRDTETFKIVDDALFAAATSPDGRSFAAGGKAGRVYWWEWKDADRELQTLDVGGSVSALAFHPGGGALFVGTYAGPQAVQRPGHDPRPVPATTAYVEDVQLSPDGTAVAVEHHGWSFWAGYGESTPIVLPFGTRVLSPGRAGPEFLIGDSEGLAWLDSGAMQRTPIPIPDEIDSAVLRDPKPIRGPGGTVLVGRQFFGPDGQVSASLPPLEEWSASRGFCSSTSIVEAKNGSWAMGIRSGYEGCFGGLVVTNPSGEPRAYQAGDPMSALAFSPDGQRLYRSRSIGVPYGSGLGSCVLEVLDAHDLSRVRHVGGRAPASLTFLDEAHALVVVGGNLEVWDVEELEPIQTVAFLGIGSVSISDDHGTVAIHSYLEPGIVRVYCLGFDPEKR